MSCSGCEIHNAIHGVVKKGSVQPKDDVIPTSSKKVALRNVVAAPIIEEKGDRTIPPLVGKLDGPNDGGVG